MNETFTLVDKKAVNFPDKGLKCEFGFKNENGRITGFKYCIDGKYLVYTQYFYMNKESHHGSATKLTQVNLETKHQTSMVI